MFSQGLARVETLTLARLFAGQTPSGQGNQGIFTFVDSTLSLSLSLSLDVQTELLSDPGHPGHRRRNSGRELRKRPGQGGQGGLATPWPGDYSRAIV
jgi:hypothetical protein